MDLKITVRLPDWVTEVIQVECPEKLKGRLREIVEVSFEVAGSDDKKDLKRAEFGLQ